MDKLFVFSILAGSTVFMGGVSAHYFHKVVAESLNKKKFAHGVMSFGAGIILSAVALVLVPKGIETLSLFTLVGSFLLGSVSFMVLDQYLEKKGGKAATLLAMMMDFLPESIALGAVFVIDPTMATLLAVFIGLQNFPEAFNSYGDLRKNGFGVKSTLGIMFVLSFCGLAGALMGHYFLSSYPSLTAGLMTFSSGGILYLLIRDIIPSSHLEASYATSLGASFGFLVGMVGQKLIG